MLTYNLEERGRKSLYEYLYECIRKDIQTDILKPDTKLPSKRELSAHLGISIITVQNAYEQLLLEGYIYAIEKKGYFISELKKENYVTSHPVSVPESGKKEEYLIDFSSNQVAVAQFPTATWGRLMRQTLIDHEADFFKSPPRTGIPELKRAIAEHLQSYRNLTVDPENMIIGAGTEYLYGLLVQLLGHNRMIAVEDPGHTKIEKVYESNGIRVLHIPIDRKGIRIDKLIHNNVSCIHITPSHHFPTGIVMPAQRRHQLISWAKEQNTYIIEDDYDSEFRFTGRPIQAMTSIAPEQVIYMNTFSKTLMPSLRIAYMILPPELMKRYRERLSFYSNTVSGFEQYNLARFIAEGYYGRYINRMRNYYRKHRDILLNILRESPLYDMVTIEEENAGLHFILGIKEEIDDETFVEELEKHRIHITPVWVYSHNNKEEFRHKFIINYSDSQEEHLQEAFETMCRIIREIKPKKDISIK